MTATAGCSLRIEQTADPHESRAIVATPAGKADVFMTSNMTLRGSVDPWVPPALLAAMWSHRPLHVDGGLRDDVVLNLQRAQRLLAGWFPEKLGVVDVQHSGGGREDQPPGTGVGCFFSGGVDAFDSALRHRSRVTHLIFVHGFDIALDDAALGDQALEAAREAADAMGKTLVWVRTNVKETSAGRLDWGYIAHGAALAAVGLALADHVGEVIIPSSYQERDLFPWGSHPELDPLWSTPDVRFVHDGIAFSRPAKVANLARHQVALDHLRVCWMNPGGAYNCGRCEKCVRTMINLRAVGALESCKTLPSQLRLRDVARLRIGHGSDRFAAENIAALRGVEGGRPLIAALRCAVLWGRLRHAARMTRHRAAKRIGLR